MFPYLVGVRGEGRMFTVLKQHSLALVNCARRTSGPRLARLQEFCNMTGSDDGVERCVSIAFVESLFVMRGKCRGWGFGGLLSGWPMSLGLRGGFATSPMGA